MYSFTLDGIAYDIPTVANEVTLKQFMAWRELQNDDELGFLTVLLGRVPTINITDAKSVQRFDKELNNLYKLIDILKSDIASVFESGRNLLTPKTVELLGLQIPIKELNTLPWFAFQHAKSIILNRSQAGQNEKFDGTDDIPELLAHCLYELVTKEPYNEAKAEDFKSVILEMNFVEALQAGNFFLLQQRGLWTTKRKRWGISLRIMKWRLVSKFLTRMGPSMYSKRLATEMLPNGN
jgi:hypothetical protein